MKANELLQVIYAFFLGLVVLAFVGIGLNTFYQRPPYPEDATGAVSDAYARQLDAWQINTSVILLIAATIVLGISLVRGPWPQVISNGLLLGGIFTMVYAVGMSLGAESSLLRFGVATLALAITVAAGYLSFRGLTRSRTPVVVEGAVEEGGVLSGRVARLEEQFAALRRALD